MHLAHMAYPGGAAWERTRERYFHRLADVHAKAQRGLREHKIKVADLLVRISKAEAAVKRGQMTLTAQEFGKYERMVRDGVRQQRREAAQQFTSGTPANESQG